VVFNHFCHSSFGNTTVNVLPSFSTLEIISLPLFFSINSLQSISPSPVPFSPIVPFVVVDLSILNKFSNKYFFIPTPRKINSFQSLLMTLKTRLWEFSGSQKF